MSIKGLWGKKITCDKPIFKFEKIFSNFESKIKNPGSKLKLTLLSGHDTDLWPLYDNLNISTSTCIE